MLFVHSYIVQVFYGEIRGPLIEKRSFGLGKTAAGSIALIDNFDEVDSSSFHDIGRKY